MNFIKKYLNKKTVIYFVITIWILFSAWYILSDNWNEFKTKQLEAVYKKGSSDAILNILKASENCRTVSLFNLDKSETKFVDVACLSRSTEKKSK